MVTETQRQQILQQLHALQSAQLEVRDQASEALLQLDDPALLPFLVGQLFLRHNRAFHVLIRVLEGFGEQLSGQTYRLLLFTAAEGPGDSRLEGIYRLLEAIGPEAAPSLVEFLRHAHRSGVVPLVVQGRLVELASRIEGPKVDELLCLYSRDRILGLRCLEALATRKSPEALPTLLEHMEPGNPLPIEFRGAAALAAAHTAPEDPRVLAALKGLMHLQTTRVLRPVLEALGVVGSEEACGLLRAHLRPPTRFARRHRPKLQAAAARGLAKANSVAHLPELVALFFSEHLYDTAWRDVSEAIVELLHRGLDADEDRFAWLRELLEGQPSPRLWVTLCSLFSRWPEGSQAVARDYLEGHLDAWPDDLRHVSYEVREVRAGEPPDPWSLWWQRPPHGERGPAWCLVRSLKIKRHRDLSASFLRFLQTEDAAALRQLCLEDLDLTIPRHMELLEGCPFPHLRRLELLGCTLCDAQLIRLGQTPWFAGLERFTVAGSRGERYYDPATLARLTAAPPSVELRHQPQRE